VTRYRPVETSNDNTFRVSTRVVIVISMYLPMFTVLPLIK